MKRKCPFCQELVEDGFAYCPHCGRRIDTYMTSYASNSQNKKKDDVPGIFYLVLLLNLAVLSLNYFLPVFEEGSLLSVFLHSISFLMSGTDSFEIPYVLFSLSIQCVQFAFYLVLIVLSLLILVRKKLIGFPFSFFFSIVSYSLFLMIVLYLLSANKGDYHLSFLILIPILCFVALLVTFILFLAKLLSQSKRK